MILEQIFQKGLELHHYANTAYPLKPTSFRDFKIREKSKIDALLTEDLSKIQELALYVHIPFCQTRCRFCEYAVFSGDDALLEDEYTDLLLREIKKYGQITKNKHIAGFDTGGGTPAYISERNLERITRAMFDTFHFDASVGLSIETTPLVAADDLAKLRTIRGLGYQRMSMGIQTVNKELLESFERKGSVKLYQAATENIRKAGFDQLNIDLMYGFLHQSEEDFAATVQFTIGLNPEYITLYRNRYKGTKIEHEAQFVDLQKVNRQYDIAFRLLNEAGFSANNGKNTFSRIAGNYGTSNYLTKRVIEGTPYLGLGLGAQSFGHSYLAYNDGAASKKLNRYRENILAGNVPIQDIYLLPKEEMIAKMISVAFYFGFIETQAFEKRFDSKFADVFTAEIEFLIEREFMFWDAHRFTLTEVGAHLINGIIPMFYSPRSKTELLAY